MGSVTPVTYIQKFDEAGNFVGISLMQGFNEIHIRIGNPLDRVDGTHWEDVKLAVDKMVSKL